MRLPPNKNPIFLTASSLASFFFIFIERVLRKRNFEAA